MRPTLRPKILWVFLNLPALQTSISQFEQPQVPGK